MDSHIRWRSQAIQVALRRHSTPLSWTSFQGKCVLFLGHLGTVGVFSFSDRSTQISILQCSCKTLMSVHFQDCWQCVEHEELAKPAWFFYLNNSPLPVWSKLGKQFHFIFFLETICQVLKYGYRSDVWKNLLNRSYLVRSGINALKFRRDLCSLFYFIFHLFCLI